MDKNGWIKVTERLPEHGRCICHKHNGLVCELWFDAAVNKFLYGGIEQTSQVLHWQPLPSPPKTEQDESK